MNKKIDFSLCGLYLCSTNKYKTCKEAKQGFLKHPHYEGIDGDTIALICFESDLKAHFSKRT